MAETCSICRRERTDDDGEYSPLQVFTGEPFGWYSGDDGEICPEDLEALIRRANT